MLSKIYELSAPRVLYLKEEELAISAMEDTEFAAETVFSAISPGTELGAYIGASALREGKIYPRIVGYCNVAKVAAIGKKVYKYKTGDYILTFQSHRSAFVIKEDDFAIKLPDGINLKYAATTYLYHLGYHSLITANAKAGHNIGVIGIGVLGFTTCMMSKILGARTFAFTNQNEVIKILGEQGVLVYPKEVNSLASILEKTHGIGLDIIINTSNTWEDWFLALNAVNKGGIIVNLGFPGRDEKFPSSFNPLEPKLVYSKSLTIKALLSMNETDIPYYEIRFNMKRNLQYILDLIINQTINPQQIISSEIFYTALEKQYEIYLNRRSVSFTTILSWHKTKLN